MDKNNSYMLLKHKPTLFVSKKFVMIVNRNCVVKIQSLLNLYYNTWTIYNTSITPRSIMIKVNTKD